jgi:hypothetical protein
LSCVDEYVWLPKSPVGDWPGLFGIWNLPTDAPEMMLRRVDGSIKVDT